ncbi:transcription termination/antitermination protein NusG [Phenylobacterium deserti]|nr:transcription termination/antitermination NusG family protein [Phenylobacterium deserti]
MSESAWYAVRTATRRERKALQSLNEFGFTAFLPCETRWTHDRNGKDVAYSPLFPGYLFVLIRPSEIHDVLEIDGVHDFVRCIDGSGEAAPMPIPAKAILTIQAEERAGAYDRTKSKRRVYRPRKGDRVMVEAGTWLGFIGKVLATPRGERAHVMLEGPFGRGVTLNSDQLRAA